MKKVHYINIIYLHYTIYIWHIDVEIGMQMGTQCELESSPDPLILLSIRCLVNMFIHSQPNYVMKNK